MKSIAGIICLASLIYCLISCKDSTESASDNSIEAATPDSIFVNSNGDTIISDKPVKFEPDTINMKDQPGNIVFKFKTRSINLNKSIPVSVKKFEDTLSIANYKVNTTKKFIAYNPIELKSDTTKIITTRPAIFKSAFRNKNSFTNLANIDIEQGLRNAQILSLFKDSKNNIWMGTSEDGFTRFDGKNFYTYSRDEGLVSVNQMHINAFIEDEHNKIYIGTNHGMLIYDGVQFRSLTIKSGLPSNYIVEFFIDKEHHIWFTTNNAICKIENNKLTTIKVNLFGLCNINSIIQTEDSTMWFGTFCGGLIKFKDATFSVITSNKLFPENDITCLLKYKNNSILMGTRNGLVKYENGEYYAYTFDNIKDDFIKCMMTDPYDPNVCWLGTKFHGVIKVTDTKYYQQMFDNADISTPLINALTKDDFGNIFIGTDGVYVYNSDIVNYTTKNGFPDNDMPGMLAWKNALYLATASGLCSLKNDTLTLYESNNLYYDAHFSAIANDKIGNIWLGTLNGDIYKYDGNQVTFITNIKARIQRLYFDSKNTLWIGTVYRGIFKYDGKTMLNYKDGTYFRDNHIIDILEDEDKNIWFTTHINGIAKYSADRFTFYTTKTGLTSNAYYKLMLDKKQHLWLASFDAGVFCYDRTKNKIIKSINHTNGLSGNYCSAIFEDNNNHIYISTPNGISILKPVATFKDSFSICKIDKSDGLSNQLLSQHNILVDEKNILWITTNSALSKIDLNKYKFIFDTLRVKLDYILMNNDYVNLNMFTNNDNKPAPLIVPYLKNNLQFNYSTNVTYKAQKIKYQSYISPLEDDWNAPTAEISVRYRKLTPGKYTFHVRALNENNSWSNPLTYHFTILHPWWTSLLAKLCYIIIAVSLVYLYIRHNTNKIKNDKIQLENIVKEKTVLLHQQNEKLQETIKNLELANKNLDEHSVFKTKLIGILGHDLMMPLQYIHKISKHLIQHKTKLNPDTFDESMQSINTTSLNLYHQSESLLYWAKVQDNSLKAKFENFDINVLLNELETYYKPLYLEKHNTLTFCKSMESLCYFDPVVLKIILNNLLTNALKFTMNGDVEVNIISLTPVLKFSVKDNGAGMNKETIQAIKANSLIFSKEGTSHEKGHGTGFQMINYLLQLLDGKMEIKSETNKITEITIQFPIEDK